MIDRIKIHNQVNGYRFSVIEFGLFILFVAPIAGYYLIHARWLLAGIAFGIILNGLPIVIYGSMSLRDHAPAGKQQAILDPQQRAAIRQNHLHLLGDTMLIAVSILLPFVHVGWVVIELANRARQTHHLEKVPPSHKKD